MRLPATLLRGVVLGFCLAFVQACSNRSEELPTPRPVTSAVGISVAEAQAWYFNAHFATLSSSDPTVAAPSTNGTTPTSSSASGQLAWARAFTVGQGAQQLVLVPLAGDAALFANSSYVGVRYLVVSSNSLGALNGHMIELLLRRSAASIDTAALLVNLYRSYRSERWAAPNQSDGLVLVYSADCQYLTGHRFRNGQLMAGTAALAFQAHNSSVASASQPATLAHLVGVGDGGDLSIQQGGTCTDWYDARTGEYITTTGNCSGGGGGGGGTYEGGGGPGGMPTGPSGYGGHGPSVGSGLVIGVNAVTVLYSGPKVDPRQETRCFNINQEATVTVYVPQAVPGTAELDGGPYGVGHTFVGIEQNGISRYLGYYPRTGASQIGIGLGINYSGEIRDNSGEVYHVSITTRANGAQLANIINYINNYPARYNLNSYNCTDFGIAIGNLAGMNLPATTTSAMAGLFNGRSPGVLGQDIRNISPSAQISINQNGGNAPSKQGTCP